YAWPNERFSRAAVTQHNRRLIVSWTHAVVGYPKNPYRSFPCRTDQLLLVRTARQVDHDVQSSRHAGDMQLREKLPERVHERIAAASIDLAGSSEMSIHFP